MCVLQVAAGFVLHKGQVAGGTLRVGDSVAARCAPMDWIPHIWHHAATDAPLARAISEAAPSLCATCIISRQVVRTCRTCIH